MVLGGRPVVRRSDQVLSAGTLTQNPRPCLVAVNELRFGCGVSDRDPEQLMSEGPLPWTATLQQSVFSAAANT